MKKTTTKTIHTFFLILIITSITFISNSKKANALLDPFSGPIFGIEISEKARKTISDIKDYINQAQQVVNTYKSSKALIKQVTNADLSNFAMNNSASQILNFGDTSLQVLSGDQGVGINVNTDGSQVVTNLGKYLDKIGVNEIRKGLNDLEDVSNLTPFTADIQKQIVDFSRNIGDTKTGKLINFTLPYIVRSEICNDPNLKNIIKNGEPADYVNAKKAVANVDIDKACQTPNLLSPKDQAVFVSLAKTGYGGAETKQALADPNNTPSAITGNAISKIIGLKNESEDTASKETTATDLVIGQKTCYDKDGKLVSFDPASIDTSHMLCYDTETSVEQSPTVVKNRTAAALLSPYISMLSRAMATTENACGSIGSSGPTYSTGVDTGKPENTTINPDLYNQPIKTPTNMPSYNPKPSGYNNQSMLRKIFSLIFTKASAQSETLGDINDIISGVNKGIDCTSQAFNSASGVMNSIVGVLNIGAKNVTQILNKEDNPYSRLAKNFESIITAQKNQKNLYTAADQAQKDYENGATGYTVDDLKQAVSTYQNIREIDVNKLNNMVFTYAFVNLAIANSKSAIPPGKHCTLGCKNKTAAANRAIANVKDSVTGLQQAAISLNNAINDLIKELAKNNYKEQQINKLYNQFLTTDTRAEDNQDTLKNLLGDAYTATDYANISMDWTYIPRFSDGSIDPTTITPIDPSLKEKQRLQEEARQTKALILPTEEKEGPYNQYNLDNLRIRAWKIFERSINPTQVAFIGLFRPSIDNCYLPSSSILNLLNCTSNSTSPEKAKEINDLFNRYSMTAIKYIDPNLPRASQKGVKNVLDANQVKSWSEPKFCENLGITNTICNTGNGIKLLQDYTNTLNDGNPSNDQLTDFCLLVNKDVNTAVNQECLNTTDSDLSARCQDTSQRQSLADEAKALCVDPSLSEENSTPDE